MEPITAPPADFVPAGEGAVSSAPTPEPAPGAEPVAPAAAPTETPDPFEDEKVQQFDRGYVEKLRKEAAERRTESARYRDVFGQYDEESQAVWMDLASTFLADPQAAAAKMEAIITAVKAQGGTQAEAEAAAAAAVTAPGEAAALTPEAVQAMFDQKMAAYQAERDLQDRTQAIVTQAKELGYEPGSTGYVSLFHVAQHQTGGDLAAAHAVIQAERQAWVDAAFEKKAKTAGPTPVNQGAAPGTREVPKTWADITAAMRAQEGAVVGQ